MLPSLHRASLLLLAIALAACGGSEKPPASAAGGAVNAPSPAPAPTPPAPVETDFAPGFLQGNWYLNTAGEHGTASFTWDDRKLVYGGTYLSETPGAGVEGLDSINSDSRSGTLRFHRGQHGAGVWYVGRVVSGVFVGRTGASPSPGDLSGHATGWRERTFDADLAPRTFRLRLADGRLAAVRLDRAATGNGFVGSFKVYATEQQQAAGEELEVPATISRWDGSVLQLSRPAGASTERYDLRRTGRLLAGTLSVDGSAPAPVRGERTQVLGHGLTVKTKSNLLAWQAQTRAALRLLMMDGDPAPSAAKVTQLRTHLAPTPAALSALPLDRDDDPAHWPQAYSLTELQFDFTLPAGPSRTSVSRRAHGYLSLPDSPAPKGGFPLVVALNGHGGSARQIFDPTNEFYWYGDAWARRGYAVLAIDLSHRPEQDRQGLYGGYGGGDSPETGNGTHPAIAAPGSDSDWEEDGERAWDVMQAVKALSRRTDLSTSRVVVTGLSMGGEVSTLVGALFDRAALTVAAGFSPDLNTVFHHNNHQCWQWLHADLREYIGTSDLHALVAPRVLLVETGVVDPTYSDLATPFAGDKQVALRSRTAFDGTPNGFVHYLHYDQHHYHFGDFSPGWNRAFGVDVPASFRPGVLNDPTAWEVDSATVPDGATVFDYAYTTLAPTPALQ